MTERIRGKGPWEEEEEKVRRFEKTDGEIRVRGLVTKIEKGAGNRNRQGGW